MQLWIFGYNFDFTLSLGSKDDDNIIQSFTQLNFFIKLFLNILSFSMTLT